MNTNETDSKFQKLFHELKRKDSASVPNFDRLAKAKGSSRTTGAPAWAWLVPAALAVFIAVFSFNRLHSRSHRLNDVSQQWAALSVWETPSDALLDAANETASTETESDTTLKPN